MTIDAEINGSFGLNSLVVFFPLMLVFCFGFFIGVSGGF